jgi:hypothetical protein
MTPHCRKEEEQGSKEHRTRGGLEGQERREVG